jgi:histidinol dehydrogenase
MKSIQSEELECCIEGLKSNDGETENAAREIVEAVRSGGEHRLREFAERLDGLEAGKPLIIQKSQLHEALQTIPEEQRQLLERAAERIAKFAKAQRGCLQDLEVAVPGGRAGHSIAAVERAGCYAPGGRYPLPSSVLMTAVTARVAGVEDVTVASPRPGLLTLAAAAVAGADRLLAAGGAQAIAALAYGTETLERSDVIAGPGNRWVTAAKRLVSGDVGIDMLAGPSELCIVADESADPAWIAADLLAQAEHDEDARVFLVTTAPDLAVEVQRAVHQQLQNLPTGEVAAAALSKGLVVLCNDRSEAVEACNRIAAEHVELMVRNAGELRQEVHDYGAIFVGAKAAEVFGDYGIGPNHVLPTSRTARHQGGLSVMSFLRIRSWLELDRMDAQMCADAAALARLEGLEAHARAAEQRGGDAEGSTFA